MKKYFAMIALAIASVMVFTGCSKDDDSANEEPVKPTEQEQELEVEVKAEISGAMTKALELTINYIDFNGDKKEVVLNKDFSGAQPTTFNQKFKTTEEGKKFGIRITARTSDYNTYKDEPAPWVASYSVTASINGQQKYTDFINEKSLSDNQTLFSSDNIDFPGRVATGANRTYQEMKYIMMNSEKDDVIIE